MNIREPKQSRAQITKDKIKEAGLNLFSKRGYYQINSKDIAKEANVSIGSFYAYFKDKKVLFIELLKDFKIDKFEDVYSKDLDCQRDDVEYSDQISMFRANIKEYVNSIIVSSGKYPPEFYMEILHLSYRDEDIKREYNLYREEEINILMEVLSDFPMDLEKKKKRHISMVIQKLIDSYVLVILNQKEEGVRNSLIRSFEEGIFIVVEEQLHQCK